MQHSIMCLVGEYSLIINQGLVVMYQKPNFIYETIFFNKKCI